MKIEKGAGAVKPLPFEQVFNAITAQMRYETTRGFRVGGFRNEENAARIPPAIFDLPPGLYPVELGLNDIYNPTNPGVRTEMITCFLLGGSIALLKPETNFNDGSRRLLTPADFTVSVKFDRNFECQIKRLPSVLSERFTIFRTFLSGDGVIIDFSRADWFGVLQLALLGVPEIVKISLECPPGDSLPFATIRNCYTIGSLPLNVLPEHLSALHFEEFVEKYETVEGALLIAAYVALAHRARSLRLPPFFAPIERY
jgi:hypothetical protein